MTDSGRPEPAGNKLSGFEKIAFAVMLAALLALRVFFSLRYRVDSDEPQHLHVVWAWANGLMQYRDVSDNHAPLFHMLMSPLAFYLGDRADLLIWMRLAILPVFAACLLATYRIGRRVFSRRTGMWSTVFIGLLPPFFLWMGDFRTDTLWTAFWLLAVAVLLDGKMSTSRAMGGGLLLGAAVSVSLKSTFLLVGLGLAALVAALLSLCCHRVAAWRVWIRWAAAALAGTLVLPAGLVVYFWAHGALGCLIANTISLNLTVAGQGSIEPSLVKALVAMSVAIPAAAAVLWRSKHEARHRQAFLVLLGGSLLAALSFWPLTPRQDSLPIYPILAVLVTAAVVELLPRQAGRLPLSGPILAAAAAVMAAILLVEAPWADQTRKEIARWRDVLSLTDPGQMVMDHKGELIFRPRGFRYVLETMTRDLLKAGALRDDIPEQLIANRTFVAATNLLRLPPRTKEFIEKNYIRVGTLCVAGMFLARPSGETRPSSLAGGIEFTIRLAAPYAILGPRGPAKGVIDGRPYSGPLMLQAGRHSYVPAAGERSVAIVWAQAVERGFLPQWPCDEEAP